MRGLFCFPRGKTGGNISLSSDCFVCLDPLTAAWRAPRIAARIADLLANEVEPETFLLTSPRELPRPYYMPQLAGHLLCVGLLGGLGNPKIKRHQGVGTPYAVAQISRITGPQIRLRATTTHKGDHRR